MASRPRPRQANRQPAPNAGDRPLGPRQTTVAIDAAAGRGQAGLGVGERVTIQGAGLYAGEQGRIERFAGSAIPAAAVRTDGGKLRHVRTIDLAAASRLVTEPRELSDDERAELTG